jgi:hypothetical protein
MSGGSRIESIKSVNATAYENRNIQTWIFH